jgi:hypothetical protein
MAKFNIDSFRETMRYGGARPHLFEVSVTLPPSLLLVNAVGGFASDILVKASATSVPASRVSEIPVAFQGRFVNFSGNRTYDPWTIEVYNDEDFNVYDAFISWLAALNSPLGNKRDNGFNSSPTGYKSIANVYQFGQDESLLKTWVVDGIFPIMVSEISLGWEQMNQIERFQVTFAVDAVVPSPTVRAATAG